MPGASATAAAYLPYDVPLRLAGALRQAARKAWRNRWRHLVPGGVLLWWRARARPRTAWHASAALPWRLLGDAAPSVTRVASPTPPVSSTLPVSGGVWSERGVAPAAPAAALVREQQATPSGARPPERGAGPAYAREAGPARRVRPEGTLPTLMVWTRSGRTRVRAPRGRSPLPEALLAARAASPPPVGGVTVARLTPSRAREAPSGLVAGRSGGVRRPAAMAVPPPSRVAPAAGLATPRPHGEVGPVPTMTARGPRRQRRDWIEEAVPWPEKETPAAAPESTTPRPALDGLPDAAPLAWKTPGLAAAWTQVSGMVERAVARQVDARQAARPPAPAAPPTPDAPSAAVRTGAPVVTEQMVTQVVSRLRALAREERFRAGRRR